MPSSLPLRFLPFVLPEGILPMRYDGCYGDSTTIYDVLRYGDSPPHVLRSKTCYDALMRQSLYESIAFMFTSNASLMLFTSLFITSESAFKKH